ncbi:hypothetical protein BC629DRAFT_1485307 [Irpex lacteus]|nr:hypothetical protein BC629DRAFT_1485307 [Irpex lacteus]
MEYLENELYQCICLTVSIITFVINQNSQKCRYPKPIPQGTAVPAWAYYNLVTTDSFNATIAEDIAQEKLLDSVSIPAPTLSLSSANNSNPPSADDDSKSSVSKSSNLAPIISGVVGSIVLIAIVAATTLLWRRQRNIMRATSSKSDTEKGEGDTIASAVSEVTVIGENPSALQTKLYDPEDPSTFPVAALRQDTRIYQPIRFNGHAEL